MISIVHIDIQLPRIVCGGGCAGVVAARPPVPPTALTAHWMGPIPTEIVQLQLQSVQPVTTFKLPLLGQTPPWPTAKLIMVNDPGANPSCKLGTIRPEGGPAAFICTRTAPTMSAQYQVQVGVNPPATAQIIGEVNLNGQDFSFVAPHM